ncbi:MAG: ribonuclease P protein component [Candidatus Omnitrophota bacterium]
MGKLTPLRKQDDFRAVFKRGKRFSSEHFTAYCKKNESPELRLGISIAKRHLKQAVGRNRVRRMAKELIRTDLAPSLKAGYDIVLISRKIFSKPLNKKISNELKFITKIIKEKSD